MEQGRTVRIGLVGYGKGGRFFHAPLIASAAGCELAGVVTRSDERRSELERDHPGTPAYDDLRHRAVLRSFPDHRLSISDRRMTSETQNAPPGTRRRWGVEARPGVRVDRVMRGDRAPKPYLHRVCEPLAMILAILPTPSNRAHA